MLCSGVGAGESFAIVPPSFRTAPRGDFASLRSRWVPLFFINSIPVVFSMFGSRCYLIFSNANVATARIRPTSQKRVTIFASGTGCDGHLIFAGMSIFW